MKRIIILVAMLCLSIPVFGQGQGVSMRSTNGAAYGITPVERLVPTKSINYGMTNSPYIMVLANGVTNIFGPFTPGTVTSGIQEALNSLNVGTQYGPTAAGGTLSFSQGDFFYTNVLTYSNIYTSILKLQGDGVLGSRLIYAGNATATNCLTVRGGGNPLGGVLDLPMHVVVRDVAFSSILERTNALVCLTNVSYVMIESANFTSWNVMTNQSWGSAVSVNGGELYPNAQGLVGLVVGNVNDHATFVNNCFFAGLAVGIESFTDHLYVDGMKFAFIGFNGSGVPDNLFPATEARSLGAAILRHPGLDSIYKNVHFYACNAGLAFLNSVSPSSDYQVFHNPVVEGCDHPWASIYPSAATIQVNRPIHSSGSEDNDAWRITNAPPYSYVNIPNTIVQHAVYALGDGSVTINASQTNSTLASKIIGADSNGKLTGATLSGLTWDGSTLTSGGDAIRTASGSYVVTEPWGVAGPGGNVINYLGDGSIFIANVDSGATYWLTGTSNMFVGDVVAELGQFKGDGGGLTNLNYSSINGNLWGTNAATGEITNKNSGLGVNISTFLHLTNRGSANNQYITLGNDGSSTGILTKDPPTGAYTAVGGALGPGSLDVFNTASERAIIYRGTIQAVGITNHGPFTNFGPVSFNGDFTNQTKNSYSTGTNWAAKLRVGGAAETANAVEVLGSTSIPIAARNSANTLSLIAFYVNTSTLKGYVGGYSSGITILDADGTSNNLMVSNTTGNVVIRGAAFATNGFLVRSNAIVTPPTLVEGDNWYFSSNGIPHVRYLIGGVTTTVRLVP